MRFTTNKGLTVWDLPTDQFDHTQMSGNWDIIDSFLGAPSKSVETLSAVPTTSNFAGRTVMLSSADSGFQPWTLIRYDGSTWRPVNTLEIQPAVPTIGNFAGRVVILSNADSGFPAWAIIRYDGISWQIVGGWQTVNTGANPTNINGLLTTADVYINSTSRGLVLHDRGNGQSYRLYFQNGNLSFEAVA